MNAMSGSTSIAVVATFGLLAIGNAAAAQQPTLPSRPVTSSTDPNAAYVSEASQRFGIPEAWIRGVMRVESAGEVGVTSSAGAMGLMQVMPQTYATLRARLGLGANAYDPHDNIMAGAAFLRDMDDRYGDAGFLAAYNAGQRATRSSGLVAGRCPQRRSYTWLASVRCLAWMAQHCSQSTCRVWPQRLKPRRFSSRFIATSLPLARSASRS